MSGIPVLGEIGVELNGVFGNHVQLGGQGVEVADYALEFLGEIRVLGLEGAVVGFVMGVGVAEGFYLEMIRMKASSRFCELWKSGLELYVCL
jgi:hypothetical protein